MANWEWVASLQYWLPKVHCTQVYHPLYNHVFERVFLRLRQQYGGETIAMRHTVRRLLTLHAESKVTVCGMIADQQPKWEAIHHFGTLLNHDSAVFVGSEQIAKKVDCPVYYASMTQIKRGYYHCHFTPIILHHRPLPADVGRRHPRVARALALDPQTMEPHPRAVGRKKESPALIVSASRFRLDEKKQSPL